MPTPTRPNWLPKFIPEFQGLRGLAILAVVLYHCHVLLEGSWIHYPSLWGWAGVDLFFVLTGYLCTTILIEERTRPKFLLNFWRRRAIHIVPVYILVILICYTIPDWFLGDSWAHQTRWPVLLGYALFLQNLRHSPLPGTLAPTWFLSVVVQYYVVWAIVMKFIRRFSLLALILSAALITSPLLRHFYSPTWLTSTHTLIHMDGLAFGSLIALGFYGLSLSKRAWTVIGAIAFGTGFWATATIFGGTSLLDTGLALGFTGAILIAITTSGARTPINRLLAKGPLAFYGTISYSLYLIHIFVFVYWGSFNARLDHMGVNGHLIIVALRILAATIAAAILYYGIESRVMKLKHRVTQAPPTAPPTTPAARV